MEFSAQIYDLRPDGIKKHRRSGAQKGGTQILTRKVEQMGLEPMIPSDYPSALPHDRCGFKG